MLVINYKGKIPQQNFYSIGVKENNKANVIMFVLSAYQQDVDLSNLTPYLKVQNKEYAYLDKIKLESANDELLNDTLNVVWEMTSKSTQYRNLELQLQFQSDDDDEVIWQTMIVEIELSETIKADQEISEKYPSELAQLEKEIRDIDTELENKVDKVEGMGLTHNDFTDTLKNKLDSVEENAQVNVIESVKLNGSTLPIENKVVEIDLSEDYYNKDQVDTFAKSLVATIDSNYVMTFTLKDNNGSTLSTQTIDLPLESVVVGGSYDSTTKSLILTLQNGNTITIPVSDLVSGLVSESDLITALANYYTKNEIDVLLGNLKRTLSLDCLAPSGDSTTLTNIAITIKDSANNEIASGTYNGTTLVFQLPINQTYKIEIGTQSTTIGGIVYFAPEIESGDSEGALTTDKSVVYRFNSTQSITSLYAVKQFLALQDIDIATKRLALVRSETNSFSVNITITNPNNTSQTYTMPLYVVEIDNYTKLVDGVETAFLGAKMQFGYALPDSIPFDEREQIQTENGETFASGIFYYTATTSGVGDKEFTPIEEGVDYQIGDDIDTYESTNNVYVFKHAWSNTQYGSGSKETARVIRYGSNVVHESNLMKWLNASGNNWFIASHLGDRLASWYEGKNGFKDWLNASDLALIEDNVAYGVYERDEFLLTNNKFYAMFTLPSGTEIAGSVNANEGNVLDYWLYLNGGAISNNANADRTIKKINSQTTSTYAWLRSPYRSYSYYVWYVSTSGSVSNHIACYSFAVLPIFTI